MPESCSDPGAEGHPFAVVPQSAYFEVLARELELRKTLADITLCHQEDRREWQTRVEELEAGLRQIAARGDYVTDDGPDGERRIVLVHPRELEEVAAIARALLKEGERDA